ncbi:hypothetical protein FSP39_015769 [Pinctada imbricata]|uniref:Uncharacterized protein n=1 Tax=Pinctada imbricata TaxID=66713 RepID=A0AA88YPJ2_PINIB|nr:hypothetical protein FSP39_015769 [Pinctada imbricata]
MGSSDCHNVSISVGQRMLIFVTQQNDGKLVAMYVAYDADAMLEEVVIYCYLENKPTGVLGDTCDPVATKAEGCTDFEGSNEGIVITNKPKPRPTTLAPTPKPEPEKTTAKPDPGYTVKDKDNGNGNKNPVNPGTKGGQTVDDGNGAGSTSFSIKKKTFFMQSGLHSVSDFLTLKYDAKGNWSIVTTIKSVHPFVYHLGKSRDAFKSRHGYGVPKQNDNP